MERPRRTLEQNVTAIRTYTGASVVLLLVIAIFLGMILFGDGIKVEVAGL